MNCYWKDLKEAEANLMSAQSASWSEPVAEALASLQEATQAMLDMDMKGNCEGCYGHHCLTPLADTNCDTCGKSLKDECYENQEQGFCEPCLVQEAQRFDDWRPEE